MRACCCTTPSRLRVCGCFFLSPFWAVAPRLARLYRVLSEAFSRGEATAQTFVFLVVHDELLDTLFDELLLDGGSPRPLRGVVFPVGGPLLVKTAFQVGLGQAFHDLVSNGVQRSNGQLLILHFHSDIRRRRNRHLFEAAVFLRAGLLRQAFLVLFAEIFQDLLVV